MDSFGLTIFSILIAVLGYFQGVPLTDIDRLQDELSKEYILDHFGMTVDRFFPIAHDNGSFANSELQPDTPSAVVVSALSEPELVGSAMDTALANFSASLDDITGYGTDIVPLVAEWNESGAWFFRNNRCLDPIVDHSGYAGDPPQIRSVAKSFLRLAVLLGLPAVLVGMLFVTFAYWRDLRAADTEMMGFTSEVQFKRASLRRKVDLATSAVDQGLDEIARYISAEQERMHQDLASFRPDDVISQEVNAFREKLELRIQSEFDRQSSWVKDYLHELEQVRQALPGPAEIRAQCEEFQETFRQAKEVHNNLNGAFKHIDGLLASLSERERQTVPSTQDPFSLIDEFHAGRSIFSNGESGSSKTSDGVSDSTQTKTQSLSQWTMASARRAMTPEEFDKAREIRRERVKMRCANRPKANSASSQSWTGRP